MFSRSGSVIGFFLKNFSVAARSLEVGGVTPSCFATRVSVRVLTHTYSFLISAPDFSPFEYKNEERRSASVIAQTLMLL